MKNKITEKDLLSLKDTLDVLKVSAVTLRGYNKQGLLKKVKDTLNKNKVYYLKSEVEKLVANRFYVEESK